MEYSSTPHLNFEAMAKNKSSSEGRIEKLLKPYHLGVWTVVIVIFIVVLALAVRFVLSTTSTIEIDLNSNFSIPHIFDWKLSCKTAPKN